MAHKAHRGDRVPVQKNAPCRVDLPPTCIAGLTAEVNHLTLPWTAGTGFFARVFLGRLNSVCQAIRGAELACRSMESGHVTTAGSCQKRILVGFGVALWRTAIRNDNVEVLREGIFEVAARACNAFICRRIARTRRRVRGGFRGEAKRGDDLFPRQSGRHRFLHKIARDSTNLRS
jgi:hypothetical protein